MAGAELEKTVAKYEVAAKSHMRIELMSSQ